MAILFTSIHKRWRACLCLVVLIVYVSTFASLVVLARHGSLTFLSGILSPASKNRDNPKPHLAILPPKVYPAHTPACPEPAPPAHAIADTKPLSTLYPKTFTPALRDLASSTVEPIDWESVLLTPNGGFLMVQEAPGDPAGYGVSMFHQLHCLTMIRQMLLGQAMSAELEAQGEAWVNDPMHWTHCLDYLVQGILCAADDTLERPMPTKAYDGSLVDGVDGMGHVHQCRNATPLWEAVRSSETAPVDVAVLGKGTVFSH